MNPFDYLVEDIFRCKDFVEYCVINNKQIPCIVSAISNLEVYTEYGVDDGISFYLQIKVTDYRPTKNDRVTYKDVTYKIESFTTDSTGKTNNVFLKSLTTK